MECTIGKVESVKQVDEGKTKGAAYDTAWVARLTDERGKPLFPECVQWLLENQKSDGSWGSQITNYHDRLISTLSGTLALKEIDGRHYEHYIQKGESYIWENIKKLEIDSCRLIGSELLLPSLMEQAESFDLDLPYHIRPYKREYHRKLEKVNNSLFYSPLTTLPFSLEFLGDNVDVERLRNVQLSNGSVGNSPSATAFFLSHTKDVNAFNYLKMITSLTGDNSVMTVYPIEVFEYGWIMYNLMLAGLHFRKYSEICDFLVKYMGQSGVGPSAQSPLADVDDTAVVCKALYEMQYPIDFQVFDAYDSGDYFFTFNFELDPSVSANVHVLDFIRNCFEFPCREDVIERLIRFLKRKQYPLGFWTDKWHISPYYPTSHAVFALCNIDNSLVERAVSWILDTQNENGMWGDNGGTLEETAYAVQALLYYHQKVDHIDIENVSRPLTHFDSIFSAQKSMLPELWIGKVLYCPTNVVLSSTISASVMYNTAAWNLCSGWSV
jgi:halimadienyl-diphosphate synthase